MSSASLICLPLDQECYIVPDSWIDAQSQLRYHLDKYTEIGGPESPLLYWKGDAKVGKFSSPKMEALRPETKEEADRNEESWCAVAELFKRKEMKSFIVDMGRLPQPLIISHFYCWEIYC